ncbi:PadR family transcriptional regulator [Halomicrobium katesii]|uniref:PadR family transcriptional regulator n=1 Tax=Halomicrobium katesii TaxID=437163 RepID=UPI000382D2F0|nr:PadR family transcriptional regulator [Halomicrobium katesii]
MTKWLQSGRRRDICIILAGEDGLNGQTLKTRLERHYDERIDPKSFYGGLSAMVDSGFLQKETEGIADEYSLTEAGENRLREQFEWIRGQLGETDG